MNRLTKIFLALTLLSPSPLEAENLVILHTNDTHSLIDPDDADGLGGVLRRKAIFDSIRAAEPNVIIADAGDFVQGTLYFNLFGGQVEQMAMNTLGYDIRILGNHEFDNGIDSLATLLADTRAKLLSTNYNLSDTPLANLFEPFAVYDFGGKKVGFIALNLRPEGMITEGNARGLEYANAVKAANAAAWWLKNMKGVDHVVALSHIGYDPSMPPGDKELATQSSDIDIIIGGHSHDFVDPAALPSAPLQPYIANAAGRPILVAQMGKSGKRVGKITLNLANGSTSYEAIPVDSRLDSRLDTAFAHKLEPYRHGVDSLLALPIGKTKIKLKKGQPALLNFAADFVFERGKTLAPDVDLAIVNKGGLRRSIPKGTITEGMIIMLMPFYNYVNVIDISGTHLLEAFNVMAAAGGNGVSENVNIDFDPTTGKCTKVLINGRPLDPLRTYRLATIDYLAKGGDYMSSLKQGSLVAKSPEVLHRDLINEFRHGSLKGKTLNPSTKPRMKAVTASSK